MDRPADSVQDCVVRSSQEPTDEDRLFQGSVERPTGLFDVVSTARGLPSWLGRAAGDDTVLSAFMDLWAPAAQRLGVRVLGPRRGYVVAVLRQRGTFGVPCTVAFGHYWSIAEAAEVGESWCERLDSGGFDDAVAISWRERRRLLRGSKARRTRA